MACDGALNSYIAAHRIFSMLAPARSFLSEDRVARCVQAAVLPPPAFRDPGSPVPKTLLLASLSRCPSCSVSESQVWLVLLA